MRHIPTRLKKDKDQTTLNNSAYLQLITTKRRCKYSYNKKTKEGRRTKPK